MRNFARAKELWYPTRPGNLYDRAMAVYLCAVLLFLCLRLLMML